jgi:hypothetical protein
MLAEAQICAIAKRELLVRHAVRAEMIGLLEQGFGRITRRLAYHQPVGLGRPRSPT